MNLMWPWAAAATKKREYDPERLKRLLPLGGEGLPSPAVHQFEPPERLAQVDVDGAESTDARLRALAQAEVRLASRLDGFDAKVATRRRRVPYWLGHRGQGWRGKT